MPPPTHINGRPVFGPPRASLPNYLLRAHLCPADITDPPITRTLSCPATATFQALHLALQTAFGWATTHTYDFKIADPTAPVLPEPSILDIIQNPMGSRAPRALLRIFETPPAPGAGGMFPFGRRKIDFMYNDARKNAETPETTSEKITLRDVFDDPRYRGVPMEYEYDFGDCWEHALEVVGRDDDASRVGMGAFVCVDGEGHACAEDVGSVDGWKRLKKAYSARNPTAEQRENMVWYESQCSNGDRQGLGGGRERRWSKGHVNRLLAEMV